MQNIADIDSMQSLTTPSNYAFSGVGLDQLGATEYTLVTVVTDISGSVSGFKNELEKCLKTILGSCKKAPRAENLLLRLVSFNSNVDEIHGFRQLADIKPSEYDNILNPCGNTALYDAVLSSLEATGVYGEHLAGQEFMANGVVYIITDGMDNASSSTPKSIKKAIERIRKEENLEAISVILIMVGASDPMAANDLDKFKTQADITQFVDLTDLFTKASPEGALAKLAGYISKSISSTSQSLVSGSATPSSSLLTI